MKNILKKITVFILAAILVFPAAACKDSGKNEEEEFIPPGIHDQGTVTITDYLLTDCGSTDYKIVIRKNANNLEQIAASEVQYFLNLSTACTPEIIDDSDLVLDENSQYISIGQNELFKQSGLTVDNELLQRSGYVIKSKDKSVFLLGSNYEYNNFGVIYSVYGFLEEMIDLKIYDIDVFKYDTHYSLVMKEFDVIEKPDFDWRRIGFLALNGSEIYTYRMRLMLNSELPFAGVHSHFTYLPKEMYFADHPDWYSKDADNTQLCLSNDEMVVEMIERVKYFLIENPESTMINFGIMDKQTSCNCANCIKKMSDYKTTQSGLNIMFVNKIAAAVSEWIKVEYPGRPMIYRTLAYFGHFQPPVDADNKPHHPAVVPREDVQIFIAPISMSNYSVPIDDIANDAILKALKGWKAISNNITIWNYAINFREYLLNFNNFGSIHANMKIMLQYGGTGFYEQAALDSFTPSFQEMRIWVESQLMWNVSQDYFELCEEFIYAYYGEAADAIWDYFMLTVSHCSVMKALGAGQSIYAVLSNSKYFSIEIVTQMSNIIDRAIEALEPLKETDEILYKQLLNRVDVQKVTPLYLKLHLYSNYYTSTQVNEMINEFELITAKSKITYMAEVGHVAISSYIIGLREKHSK